VSATRPVNGGLLAGRRRIATVFLAFAFAYFFSTLVRAITATLSPTLTAEFELESRDLGLLAGGYFLGFAFTQLPALFWISIALLATYWLWGVTNPRLAHRGIRAARLLSWGMPLGMFVLALILIAGPAVGTIAWICFLCASTVVTLAQPAVALALPTALAGRALSAYNLVVFAGVFVVQWGIGLLIDLFALAGLDAVASFRAPLAVFWPAALCRISTSLGRPRIIGA
jgi:MFS family permease